ncbi:hypothetical protein HPB52_025690 [Rhipicephalus sanguineus]|uniref:Uncharacterized protein n=1 Tax=Rhipicephalus sanguineus TaxID=34632 RepID=A0A9D4TCM2_RHISA|nr:hypothetical protein HPB52_025690 [Rhipicephalus sanguineus]
MVSFNGYFGCTWCLNPGEHREGSLRYTVVSPIMMRTSDQVKSEMRLASQFKDTINGLKGPSALMNLKGFLAKYKSLGKFSVADIMVTM